jgi:hypothetical protein
MGNFQKPFDQLRHDSRDDEYTCTLKHYRHMIKFSVSVHDQYTLDDAIPVAKELWAKRTQWFKDAQALAVDEQLENLNCYLDPPHPELPQLTKSQFRKLLAVPYSIDLEMDEDQIWFQFTYLSDSFGEHSVKVSVFPEDNSMDTDTWALY